MSPRTHRATRLDPEVRRELILDAAERVLTDRLPAGDVSRSVTLYTSSFSVGVGLSFLVSQLVADRQVLRIAKGDRERVVFVCDGHDAIHLGHRVGD